MNDSLACINEMSCEKLLSPTSIEIADYVINPYRGCVYGCIYCYARKNKAFLKQQKKWGTFVDVKTNALEVLDQEMKKINPTRVLIGSITESYQPAENRYRLTRGVIKKLSDKNIPVTILTKSNLIVRDIDLLSKVADNKICFTINTLDEGDKLVFEPFSSSIKARIKAVRELNEKGINAYVHIGPVFPYITDAKGLMENLNGVTDELVFESYNMQVSQEQEVYDAVRHSFPEVYEKFCAVFSSEEIYNRYWKALEEEILELNKKYNYKITFFFRTFKTYYNS